MADAIADLLATYIRQELPTFFPNMPVGSLAVAATEGPRRYRRSIFYRFPVLCNGVSTGRAAFAKITRRPGEERLEQIIADTELIGKAQEEYVSLGRLHTYFSQRNDPACGSVRPLGYLPAANALFTEELSARTLRDLVMPALGLQQRISEAQTHDYLRKSGHWLRLFHEMPVETRRQRFDAARYLELARSYFADLKKLGCSVAECDKLYASLEQFIATRRLTERDVTIGWRHGDYNLRNILVGDDGKIIGFDTKMRRTCPIWEDVAIFLVELRAHKGLVLSRGHLYNMQRLDNWERAFLAGYTADMGADADFLAIYRALYALRKWTLDLRVYGSTLRAGRWLGRVLVNNYFSAMMKDALHQPNYRLGTLLRREEVSSERL